MDFTGNVGWLYWSNNGYGHSLQENWRWVKWLGITQRNKDFCSLLESSGDGNTESCLLWWVQGQGKRTKCGSMCMGRLQTGTMTVLTLVVGSVAQRCWSHWGYYTLVDHGLHVICHTSNIFNGKVPLFYKITCSFLESSQAIIKNNLVCGQGRIVEVSLSLANELLCMR